jgi:predicted nucleic acid-binding protein
VLAWLQAVDNANLQLAPVSLGENQAGIEITREQDAAKASAWSHLMHRRSDTLYEDAMIAAIALVHGLTVVTRNVKDFDVFGVELFNPFEYKGP